MSYLQRIASCNMARIENYLPFHIDGKQTGWLKRDFAGHLTRWPDIFVVNSRAVALADSVHGFSQRTEAVDLIIHQLVEENIIRCYLDEPYPVTTSDRNQAMMTLDRGAVPYFGLRSFGQHINGFVRKENGIFLWIARRARDRMVEPGKLDNMVAGGLPWHISPQQNLVKECAEEAGMSKSLALRAQATGTVSYLAESKIGIKPDTLYCYDIELPEDFTPVCTDGEVESFQLMPVEKVMQIVRHSEEFKPNCNLVIIDFLIRHGLLDSEEADYTELVCNLHRQL